MHQVPLFPDDMLPINDTVKPASPPSTQRPDPLDAAGTATPEHAPDNPTDNTLNSLLGPHLKALHPDWQAALRQPEPREALVGLNQFLKQRLLAGARIFPRRPFRALDHLTPDQVRVVILGQDPYHGPGQAQGLAFSVPDTTDCPPSLRNIFKELAQEYPGTPLRRRNDLSDWADQGVLLLNTSLTVEAHQPASHAKKGWETVTDALIACVAGTARPKVFLLWGSHAQAKRSLIEASAHGPHLVLLANHPSPLSALRPPRPFIGCNHFLQASTWLEAQGSGTLQWLSNGPVGGA